MRDHDYRDDGTLRSALRESSTVEIVRFLVGIAARGVYWLCFLFIVGNAVMQAVRDGNWLLVLIETGAFPLTFFIYPFAAPEGALAWPLPDGTSFIPFLAAAVIAYPISTFIGGLDPVD